MPLPASHAALEIDEAPPSKQPTNVGDTSLQQQDGEQVSWILPLCISHAAAAWGERSWEFGAGLLLLRIHPNAAQDDRALRLTAILVLVECAACSLLSSRIGRAIDSAPFLSCAIVTLAIQNIGIAAAAGFLVLAFEQEHSNHQLWLAAGAIACSVLARLASVGSTIAVEKKWVTALSHYHSQHVYGRLDSQEVDTTNDRQYTGNVKPNDNDETDESMEHEVRVKPQSSILSQVNARLRCIDLTCNLCAPIAVGFLLESTSPPNVAISIAAFNALAWPIEVSCLFWIYRRYRNVLSTREVASVKVQSQQEEGSEDAPRIICESWILYYQQIIFRSALALAVLYFSVVSFGTLMTAWLAASGFHAGHLGAARALAALSGMLSTVATPRLVPALGVETAGLGFIWFMWSCILPCAVVSFYASVHVAFLWIIVVSVIVSRFGLWGFDLCVTELLQERIEPPEKIGQVNGTQVALQNAFDALAALSCVLLPNPGTFCYLILGSFGSVTIAALLHTCQWRLDSRLILSTKNSNTDLNSID